MDSRECKSFRLLQVDLLQPSSRHLVLELVRSRRIFYVHAAPPCSTSSQAREIPLAGGFGPKPLRSFNEPDGISGLRLPMADKVSNANKLYAVTAEIMLVY